MEAAWAQVEICSRYSTCPNFDDYNDNDDYNISSTQCHSHSTTSGEAAKEVSR
jgi:hypothetical protein